MKQQQNLYWEPQCHQVILFPNSTSTNETQIVAAFFVNAAMKMLFTAFSQSLLNYVVLMQWLLLLVNPHDDNN